MGDAARRPGNQYWSLVEPAWHSISVHSDPDEFLRRFRSVGTQVGHLFAAHWCQSEVCNGGFHQFFSNSTGVLAPEALEAFRAIGLSEWAGVLDEAVAFFGNPYPREQARRLERLASHVSRSREEWDPFYRLDERFLAWLHAEENRWENAADSYASRACT